MIIYFTGTGNSKYIADSLALLLKDEVVSSNDYLQEAMDSGLLKKGPATYKYFLDTKTKGGPEFNSRKPYVFVCPVYCAAPSMLFFSFLKTCRFSGSQKAYFILNGNGPSSISDFLCKELCKAIDLEYMGDKTLAMPQNYIAFFKMQEKEACQRKVRAAGPGIARIALFIREENQLPSSKHSLVEVCAVRFVLDFYFRFFVKTKAFKVSDACISCGKCSSVCPLGNIRLLEIETGTHETDIHSRRPVWGDQCTHCMACINLCPKDAIEYGKHSKGKPRYRGVVR